MVFHCLPCNLLSPSTFSYSLAHYSRLTRTSALTTVSVSSIQTDRHVLEKKMVLKRDVEASAQLLWLQYSNYFSILNNLWEKLKTALQAEDHPVFAFFPVLVNGQSSECRRDNNPLSGYQNRRCVLPGETQLTKCWLHFLVEGSARRCSREGHHYYGKMGAILRRSRGALGAMLSLL